MPSNYLWWQRGIIYQIYPRSFMDSDGDGVGDLPGITARLDYLRWLGVDALWLSPIFPSPMADFGYDVSDYTGIHPLFGTLDDFDRLAREAHARGLKVILDYVPNHTSDEHPWFVESRSSRDNPKRDWYVWRDPAPDGGPPNNWLSTFGGPAWTLDPAVVGNVIAEVGHRRRIEGRKPDGVDAQRRGCSVVEVVEPARDAGEVADPVAVRVLEASRIDLVDHPALPPLAAARHLGEGNSGVARTRSRPLHPHCSHGSVARTHGPTRDRAFSR